MLESEAHMMVWLWGAAMARRLASGSGWWLVDW